MNTTSIEWCDLSVNPIRARRIDGSNRVPGHFCQKVSPGCALCYSSRFQARFGMAAFPSVKKSPAEVGEEVFLDEDVLASILRRKKPARIFWCDMTDMFGDWVPFDWIDKCFAVMALTPHLTHQVLTKRPERMAAYFQRLNVRHEVSNTAFVNALRGAVKDAEPYRSCLPWPLPNVWLGTSCENQPTADERIPHLLRTPAAVRFLSCEPLLDGLIVGRYLRRRVVRACEELTDRMVEDGWSHPGGDGDHAGIDWVICGGESGPGSRPMHPDWARSLRDQCAEANVPFFFKQWGAWAPAPWRVDREKGESTEHYKARSEALCATHAFARWGHNHEATHKPWSGERISLGPDHAAIRRVGKHAAGRLLDGVEHNAFPSPSHPLCASVSLAGCPQRRAWVVEAAPEVAP